MGRSLISNHIHNAEKLTKAQFKKKFTDMMKAKGYTKATEDNAEFSYGLAFSSDRKWVTVLAEESGNSAELAKGLGLQVLKVELVDSDFAELTLFDKSGIVDTMYLGEPYFDEYPEPSPLKWQTILGIDWAKVEKIQQGDYTFAEDALCEFGEVIGCENMLSEYNNVPTDVEWLYFKKAAEKKLTLNSAFKKYFGELLEPMGFEYKKIGKGQYYIRVINKEILQFVTCYQTRMRKQGYKSFDIRYYVTPLYRRTIPKLDSNSYDFSVGSLKYLLLDYLILCDYEPLQDHIELGKKALKCHTDLFWVNSKLDWSLIPEDQVKKTLNDWLYKYDFQFDSDYSDGIELAKDYGEKLLLPILVNTVTTDQYIDRCFNDFLSYFYSASQNLNPIELDDFEDVHMNSQNTSLSLIIADYKKDITDYLERVVARKRSDINNGLGLAGAKDEEEYIARFRQQQADMLAIREKILSTPELKKRALKMAEEFRKNNLEILRSYGLKI